MKKPQKKPPSRDARRKAATGLSSEDRQLWQNVTGSIAPLDAQLRRDKRDHLPDMDAGAAPPAPPGKRKSVAPTNFAAKARQEPRPQPGAHRPGPHRIDRRAQRKIAKGRTPIDSTLDLHGMTQEQAFSRLCSHIEAASSAGQRCVLVITGKGAPSKPLERTSQGDGAGVLRRNLPDWLANPALSGLVSGIAPAGRDHGGGGAFYLRLRKQP